MNIENKILSFFYEYPNDSFTIRKISKSIDIPKATVHKYIVKLKSEELILEDNSASNSFYFKTKKINYFIEKIVCSGIIDYLIKKYNPSCIILFGSIRKGESVKESDIDIFIESALSPKINLLKYEKYLDHKIDVFVQSDINKLPVHLFNNIVNGIGLYGNFKIK